MRGRKKKEKGMLQRLKSRKRKKFGTVFLHRWLVAVIILVLAYLAGVSAFATYKKNELKTNYYWAQGHNIEHFAMLSQNFEGQQLINRAQMRLAMMTNTHNCFSLLWKTQTGEVIASCEEKMFFIRNTGVEADEIKILVCELDDIQGWKEYRQKLEAARKPFIYLYEALPGMDTIYSDGDFFVPKEFHVDVTKVNLLKGILVKDYTEKGVFQATIKGTEIVPELYTEEHTSGYSLRNPIALGYHPTNSYMMGNRSGDDAYNLLWDYYEARRTDTQSSAWEERETFFTVKIVSDMEVELGKGHMVSMLSVAYLNVWENYVGALLGIGVAMLLLGTLIAFLLAKLSYTRLKAAYALEDYRKNLTNILAHDLKSPLMSISGYAENLRDNLNTEKQTYYSQSILNGVQYMNGIIESVLYLSKMEEGKLSLKKEPIQVREMVEKLVAEREENLQEGGLKAEMTGGVQLEADAILLKQLLCNLLDNAVKYASKDTTICVIMKDKEISIQNVCEEDLSAVADTLCDPFVVSDDSRSNRKGSGLGLAIARNICELHGFGFELICKEKSFEAKIKG
ncbi:MAG: HAMP domain-containing histidine kinase [Lachnospiraceae bacterium]|nr:HAMP domain-containing histidine kinase [Lachnospiraceae bacterium]